MKAFVTVLFVIAPALARADAKLDKSATWDCKKDPVVSIGTGGGKYTFKGPCTTINLGAGKNTLDIESVDTLNINAGSCTITAAKVATLNLNGAKNTITLGTVGTIDFTGANNNVTWKKAKTGDKPTFKGQPDKNTVSQGK